MNESQYRVAKIFVAIALLIVLYLFALNGRYTFLDGYRFDKWNNKAEKVKLS